MAVDDRTERDLGGGGGIRYPESVRLGPSSGEVGDGLAKLAIPLSTLNLPSAEEESNDATLFFPWELLLHDLSIIFLAYRAMSEQTKQLESGCNPDLRPKPTCFMRISLHRR